MEIGKEIKIKINQKKISKNVGFTRNYKNMQQQQI
jgi:hypothetical protein